MNNVLKMLHAMMESDPDGGPGFRKDIFRDEFKKIIVDTVESPDCGWETGIERNEKPWIIVEEYSDRAKAKKGHAIWVKKLKKTPKCKLKECRTAEEWFFG